MVQNSADASTALARTTNEANAALAQLQSDFALAKKTFQDQLFQDLNASTMQAQTYLERLVNSMNTAVQTTMTKLTSATKEIQSETANLKNASPIFHYYPRYYADLLQNVHGANVDATELRNTVSEVFMQVSKGEAELAAAQSQQWSQSHEIVAQVHGSLQNMRTVEVNALLGIFQSMHSQLVNDFCES